MSESGDVFEERPIAEGQEDEVPSTASMRAHPTEAPTVPPEPCLEPRPPVDGAPDATESTPLSKKVPTSSSNTQDPPQSVFTHSAPSPFVPPSQQPPHVHPAVPSHLHGGPGSRAKISPLAQMQFAKPSSKFHPGGGVQALPGQKVTPEQAEEAKLKSKYGKLNKPGGSDFLRMRLNKGGQKYFDSGDYNMAKSKGSKAGFGRPTPLASKPGLPRPIEVTTGDTIPTPDSIHHRKTSVEISKLAV